MERVPFTFAEHETIKARLKRMKEVDRPTVIKQIETAREHGDLKENAEYHAAKERQGFIEAEIRDLEMSLSASDVIDPAAHAASERVVYGCTVEVFDVDKEEELRLTITNRYLSNPSDGLISNEAPLARALMGREIGDEVVVKLPSGERTLEILDVEYG